MFDLLLQFVAVAVVIDMLDLLCSTCLRAHMFTLISMFFIMFYLLFFKLNHVINSSYFQEFKNLILDNLHMLALLLL
jgi:hypothetical protein